jgi:hypothetical protein
MTLVHSDLPDHELARGHEKGWNYFLGIFHEQFGNGSRKEYRWEDAHPSAINKEAMKMSYGIYHQVDIFCLGLSTAVLFFWKSS